MTHRIAFWRVVGVALVAVTEPKRRPFASARLEVLVGGPLRSQSRRSASVFMLLSLPAKARYHEVVEDAHLAATVAESLCGSSILVRTRLERRQEVVLQSKPLSARVQMTRRSRIATTYSTDGAHAVLELTMVPVGAVLWGMRSHQKSSSNFLAAIYVDSPSTATTCHPQDTTSRTPPSHDLAHEPTTAYTDPLQTSTSVSSASCLRGLGNRPREESHDTRRRRRKGTKRNAGVDGVDQRRLESDVRSKRKWKKRWKVEEGSRVRWGKGRVRKRRSRRGAAAEGRSCRAIAAREGGNVAIACRESLTETG